MARITIPPLTSRTAITSLSLCLVATSGCSDPLLGEFVERRGLRSYLHASEVFAVRDPSFDEIWDDEAGVTVFRSMPPSGTVTGWGWDIVRLVEPELSFGRGSSQVMEAIVGESRPLWIGSEWPPSIVESRAITAFARSAMYAKVLFPPLPLPDGLLTMLTPEERQVLAADVVAYFCLIDIEELELLLWGMPVRHLVVASFNFSVLEEEDVDHRRSFRSFLARVVLDPRNRYRQLATDGHLPSVEGIRFQWDGRPWVVSTDKVLGLSHRIDYVRLLETVTTGRFADDTSPDARMKMFVDLHAKNCSTFETSVVERTEDDVLFEWSCNGCEQWQRTQEIHRLVSRGAVLYMLAYARSHPTLWSDRRRYDEWTTIIRNAEFDTVP